ncbi:MAG: alpha/beta hydrolase [Pseudomonadales bacterium]|nr:alpha/beta hydrolase [Pseudomonadales bacterium]
MGQNEWLECGDARIHYQTAGTVGQPIVFVHGLTCSLADWHFQVEHFSDKHRIASIDLRGHGESRGGEESIGIETFASDVVALLEQLNFENVILVGHSMGCRVVMAACYMQSSRISGLVLIDGSRLGEGSADEIEASARAHVASTGYKTFHHGMFETMFTPDSNPEMRDSVMARCASVPETVGVAAYIGSIRWDALMLMTVLPNLAVPILILQSTYVNDQRVRVSLKVGEVSPWMSYVLAEARDAQVEVIPDVGHFTMLERPNQVNEMIKEFITQRFDA